MNGFEYRRPARLGEVLDGLRGDAEAKLLAGGQSLLAAMKLRFAAPTLLIDLQGLPALKELRAEGTGLWIGAMCCHASVAASALVRERAPVLAALAGGIGDQQVRNRGTLGGSIANADPAACWPAGVLALNATVCTDRREIAADDFFTGLFGTALEADEVVCGVRFPAMAQARYLKFEQPASRFALTGVAVARHVDGVRVAVTGLGNGIWRWAAAEQALSRRFEAAALQGLAIDPAEASGDIHATAEYRAHLAGVLTRRAVQDISSTLP
ncbi:carbon monoxide dehydrogenase [Rhodoferax koreense]|uniref:Carbon monoxide dehydrogenase n=1 Tax=Rhodoferax koreensis TaxID=1842727 RepID=A0A1P8JR12_9BURK|nr:xanthine dehydrogenase family protein subunit M [Rhodoferax koreense]APW36193.1 carbon monoxide dehydrogenase [Rhodoferax koreense]